MKINFANSTIEISKAFANKAKVYNSEQYKLLKQIREENAGFAVVVVSVAKKSTKNSKVTLDDMVRYISFHDDEQKSKMREFEAMRNAKGNGEIRAKSFFEIKKWFFEAFPEVA